MSWTRDVQQNLCSLSSLVFVALKLSLFSKNLQSAWNMIIRAYEFDFLWFVFAVRGLQYFIIWPRRDSVYIFQGDRGEHFEQFENGRWQLVWVLYFGDKGRYNRLKSECISPENSWFNTSIWKGNDELLDFNFHVWHNFTLYFCSLDNFFGSDLFDNN